MSMALLLSGVKDEVDKWFDEFVTAALWPGVHRCFQRDLWIAVFSSHAWSPLQSK